MRPKNDYRLVGATVKRGSFDKYFGKSAISVYPTTLRDYRGKVYLGVVDVTGPTEYDISAYLTPEEAERVGLALIRSATEAKLNGGQGTIDGN